MGIHVRTYGYMEQNQVGSLIRCFGCKAYNDHGSKYCLLCGSKLHKECPSCGTKGTDHLALHCTECGAKYEVADDRR